MNTRKHIQVISMFLLTCVFAAPASAQSEAGTCAAVQGSVEIQHAGAWQGASVGAAVFAGDHLRTGARSRATVVLRDDSVIDIAPNTELGVETEEVDESARRLHSLLHLAGGKIRVWASAAHTARARFEVESPTAVATVRSAEFIMSYDGTVEASEIVGLEGQVAVHAKLTVMGAGVEVGPHFLTRVAKGRFPAVPQRVNAARLPQYLDGVDLIGTGRRDGLNVLHAAVLGRVLTPQDVPGPEVAPSGRSEAATALSVQAPQPGSVADSLSPDVYTNTQPLRDYQQTPPGQVPPSATGGVHVGF